MGKGLILMGGAYCSERIIGHWSFEIYQLSFLFCVGVRYLILGGSSIERQNQNDN